MNFSKLLQNIPCLDLRVGSRMTIDVEQGVPVTPPTPRPPTPSIAPSLSRMIIDEEQGIPVNPSQTSARFAKHLHPSNSARTPTDKKMGLAFSPGPVASVTADANAMSGRQLRKRPIEESEAMVRALQISYFSGSKLLQQDQHSTSVRLVRLFDHDDIQQVRTSPQTFVHGAQ